MSLLKKLITLAKDAVDAAIATLEEKPAQTKSTIPAKSTARSSVVATKKHISHPQPPAPKRKSAPPVASPQTIYERLIRLGWRDRPGPLFKELLATETAETAVYLLKTVYQQQRHHDLEKSRIEVYRWLDTHPDLALTGLTAVTDDLDAIGAEARDHVGRLVRRYPDKYPLFAANSRPHGWQPTQRWREKRPFTSTTTPDWLNQASAIGPASPHPLPDWLAPDNLPLLDSGDDYLSNRQVTAVLQAMRASSLENPAPLIVSLRENLETAVSTQFAVSLLIWWNRYYVEWRQTDWILNLLFWWHSPELPHQIIPILTEIVDRKRNSIEEQKRALQIIKLWERTHDAANLQAMRHLESFARLGKIRTELRATLERCMKRSQLDRSQFEDQLIVTLGLDANSRRLFSYQGQDVPISINADLTPRIRNSAGLWQYELPDMFRQDNTLSGRQISAYWDQLQDRLPTFLETQLWRLNRALVYERRWSWADFSRLFFQHPIMRHVARSIIWGRYAFNGEVTHAFVLTEDNSALSADYDHIELPSYGNYGLIHPIDLTPAQRATWQTLLLDYEIITIFDQLTRPVYQLTSEEKEKPLLTRFSGTGLPEAENHLHNLHWKPVGAYKTYRRWFPYSNISALLTIQQHITRNGQTMPRFEALRFAKGRIETNPIVGKRYFWQLNLPWIMPRHVRPRIISEALWNWAQVTGQAELDLE